MPDALPALVSYLDSQLTARVSVDLVGFATGDSWLVVSTSGGTEAVRRRLWALSIDLNAYAPDRPAAHALCLQAIDALYQMPGYLDSSLVVTAADVATTPADLTDPLNQQYRFVAAMTVYVRPR